MLMPTLSVTLIGLIMGSVAGIVRGTPGRSLLQGLVAAWSGFVVGAFLGVLVDALLGTGTWLTWIGHAGAVAAAAVTFTLRRSPETVSA